MQLSTSSGCCGRKVSTHTRMVSRTGRSRPCGMLSSGLVTHGAPLVLWYVQLSLYSDSQLINIQEKKKIHKQWERLREIPEYITRASCSGKSPNDMIHELEAMRGDGPVKHGLSKLSELVAKRRKTEAAQVHLSYFLLILLCLSVFACIQAIPTM